MKYKEKQNEKWATSVYARKVRAYRAERAGYPGEAAARYILGTGLAPWSHSVEARRKEAAT